MTRSEFLARFPHASEAAIRANCHVEQQPKPNKTALLLLLPNKPAKKPKRRLVPRTRNAGTWTEAEFWGRLRSCLRRMSIYWKPARIALHAARTPFHGPRGQKWAFLCADCNKLFKRSAVELDHDTPAGALTCYEHIGPFLARLLPEDTASYKVRCKKCHLAKTNAERSAKSTSS